VPTALVIERCVTAGLKPGVIGFAEPMALLFGSSLLEEASAKQLRAKSGKTMPGLSAGRA